MSEGGAGSGSGTYTGTFPVIAAGVYHITLYEGAVAATDPPVGHGVVYWDGTAEIDIYTLDTTIEDDVIGAGGDTLEDIDDKIDVIDALIDQLIIDQNKVLNIVDETEEVPSLQITVE